MPSAAPGTTSALATWLTTQCAQYDTLLSDQHDLLADIGITADRARSAAARPAENEADFTTALRYARSYHAAHGTLAAEINTVHDGFQLGRWLRRQRQHTRTDTRRSAPPSAAAKALGKVDPWWCPPWSLAWQRAWQQIHDQIKAGHRLDADHHFRSFAPAQRTWLRAQRHRYDDLHPGQQRLLTSIGLSHESARTRPLTPYAETALSHARAYADTHPHTLAVAYSTAHDGFPLGRWLNDQRQQARREATPNARHQALTAIDPWWNPPWDLAWQRACTRARTTQARPGGQPADVRSWIRAQHAAWTHLRPQQQQLLTDLGITPSTEKATGRRRASRVYPSSPGLAHARAYAALHGHLACSKDTRHDGFALGDWLVQTRRRARQGRLSPTTIQVLEALDPWWCPPWPHPWQRTYLQAQVNHHTGRPYSPALQRWADRQRTRWNALHPQQQNLLTTIDIHPNT